MGHLVKLEFKKKENLIVDLTPLVYMIGLLGVAFFIQKCIVRPVKRVKLK